jgi:hypothetical protein
MTGAPVEYPYKSDRWVTPAVIVTLILAVLAGLVSVIAAAAYLTSIGKDPGPMYDFVVTSIGGLTGSASLVLQLANRKTNTKTERNTGLIASQVPVLAQRQDQLAAAVEDALYEPAPTVAAAPGPRREMNDDTSYALPPVPGRPSPVAR